MIATEIDIVFLAERVSRMRNALQAAYEARRSAREVLNAAENAEERASYDLAAAENALVVAAGGRDRSFQLWRDPDMAKVEPMTIETEPRKPDPKPTPPPQDPTPPEPEPGTAA